MRVVIADPPAYTPPYDYALAAALVRSGVNVRLLTSRFRFGAVPEAEGFTVDDSLYRRLERGELVARPARGEGPRASTGARPARPGRLRPAPSAVGRSARGRRLLLHTRRPLVFTAHDLLPRRTASHTSTWKRLFGRFDRVVTHSERGRRTLEAFGVGPGKLRVIPHPAFRSDPVRHDDGRTVLALGVIRPYKGLPDAIEAVGRIPVRGCSSPAIRGSRSTSSGSGRAIAPSGGSATWAATRWPTRSAQLRSPSSPTAPSSTSPARCCR